MREDFNTLYVDPGEDTGWVIGNGTKLLSGGTEKMWLFCDEVWEAVQGNPAALNYIGFSREGVTEDELAKPIQRIVCEDWRIYPWLAKDLSWDQCRTARLIGALTFIARVRGFPFILQGAAIKERAVAGGAEELYARPLHENRHMNDAVQHFFWYIQTELVSQPLLDTAESVQADA